jgi:archaemetzincin
MRVLLGIVCLCAGCQCSGATPSASAAPPTASATASGRVDRAARGPDTVLALEGELQRLAPLHVKKQPPRPGDWLTEHPEPGQTFARYRAEDPIMPDLDAAPGKRHLLYVQPLGALSATQRHVVEVAAEYLERIFGLPVRMQTELALELVPPEARRIHPDTGEPQILTSWVLDSLLEPRLPSDAAASISFTASDLWPGEGWNFVFGQASLRDRVGVWSMHRLGDPDGGPVSYHQALLRTLKIAVHETSHMFSLEHCTAYECVMNGANHLDETDRSPLWLCPECSAKIAWATGADPAATFEKLADLCDREGLREEAAFFRKSIAALR